MSGRLVRACCMLFLAVVELHVAQAAALSDFTDYSLRDARGQVVMPGRLFIPAEATSNPASPRPLIVFLHGGAAAGANNMEQIAQTPQYMLDEAKRRGAFLYVPQTATNWAPTAVIDSVMTMINRAVTELNANPNRLYAAGYSMGGGGAWNLLSRNSNRFAAAMTVSSVIPAPGFVASNLLGTAILTLHARDDANVPVARTRAVVSGILAAAGESQPVYPPTRSELLLLVSNPSIEFHRQVADSQPPGSTANFFIARPDLDLMYLESPDGGHTGLFSVFFAPPVYDWMFSHGAAVPEPRLWTMTGMAAIAITIASRSRKTKASGRFCRKGACAS